MEQDILHLIIVLGEATGCDEVYDYFATEAHKDRLCI